MAQHYTRNTVSAQAYCPKCGKQTMHRVDDRRIGPCLDCIARLEREHGKVTTAQRVILSHRFESEQCPVCNKGKQSRWCFCRGCYFALKTAQPALASGLWHEAFDGTDRFFENYARAKAWLSTTGLQRTKDEQGGLFA